MVVFVHNLSYEFQFLKGIWNFSNEDVFAVKSRKVLKCNMDKLEFRCSYLHSNMSLDEYTHKMGVEHAKKHNFDYDKVRYPWTELSEAEMEYCLSDVVGLVEAIKTEMQIDGDNLYTFPLTSTGYVRRDTKRSMRGIYHTLIPAIAPDLEQYQMLRDAFRGGDTHANRFFIGSKIQNVKSADRSSSYPDVICNCKFPMGRFIKIDDTSMESVLDIMTRREHALLIQIEFYNLRLRKEDFPCPYLSKSKCQKIEGDVIDNGRVLEAEYLITTLTDIDLRIFLEEYDWDGAVIIKGYHTKYAKLPQPVIDVNIEYYRKKTELKGVDGEEIYYMKSKNKLNSVYGMMAQDPVKHDILFIDKIFREDTEGEDESILNKYNSKAFLAYQWGVWVTAWARYRLHEAIWTVGDDFIYCDTDSVKYIGEHNFDEYNRKRIEDSLQSGLYAADKHGVTHYGGVMETEQTYHEFKTWGAKKYGYNYEQGGKTYITIAGVVKKKGGEELDKYGGLDAFKPGFIFVDAGGTESIYNDNIDLEVEVDGKKLRITDNVAIKDSTYELGLSAEYKRLLEGLDIL